MDGTIVVDWFSSLSENMITAGIAAGTAILVMLIGSIFVPWLRHRAEQKRAARYLAIRVVCILDKYVAECATVSGDSGEEDHDGILTPRHTAPDPPVYPSDVNWHSIDHQLMYDLLSLPAAAERSANYVSGAAEHSFPPDYEEVYEARIEEYGKLAVRAHELTERLRKTYGIAPLDDAFWSPAEYAQKQLDELRVRKAAERAAYKEALEKAETKLI